MIGFVAITLGLVASQATRASDFDTCVLDHMQNVNSDFAAKSVKVACVGATGKDISLPSALKFTAQYEQVSYSLGTPYWSLVVRLDNDSQYTISEVVVQVVREGTEKTYVIHDFNNVEHWHPGDPVVTGLPPDPTWHMMMRSGVNQFLVPSSPSPAEIKAGQAEYTWKVVSVKGWSN